MGCRSVARHSDYLLQFLTMPGYRYSVTFFLFFILTACSSLKQQSLNGPGWYQVKPTDTLYSIAWRYAIDYQDLARWNGLSDPYIIHPGQQLVLIKTDKLPTPGEAASVIVEKTKASPSVSVKTLTPSYSQVIRWRWPTQGKVLNRFSNNDLDRRGIDIAGKIGQPVYAVDDGKVVYSGTGLSGYGNLIIVKHNNTFLSAYAFNRKRLVQEGALLKRGAMIAEMGQGKDNIPMLHFQIRKQGKPVDPMLYLPDLE